MKIMSWGICEILNNSTIQLMSNLTSKMTQKSTEGNGILHFFLKFGMIKLLEVLNEVFIFQILFLLLDSCVVCFLAMSILTKQFCMYIQLFSFNCTQITWRCFSPRAISHVKSPMKSRTWCTQRFISETHFVQESCTEESRIVSNSQLSGFNEVCL